MNPPLTPRPVAAAAWMRDARQETSLAAAIADLLDNADRSLERDREGTRRLIARATRLLAARLLPQLACPATAPERSGLAPWQVQRVTAKVAERLGTKLSVAELAATARLSSHHFSRAFKVSFGRSPHAYILRQRIERAQHLMLTTSDSLAQVAVACGLSDQAHLSRLFRQAVGTTPSAWRRQHRAQR